MSLQVNGIEQNYQYALGQLGGITSGTKAKGVQRVNPQEEQPWGAAAATVQNGELTPNLGASGSHYTNGPLGHSRHTFNMMF